MAVIPLDVVRTVEDVTPLDILKNAVEDAEKRNVRQFALIILDADQEVTVYHSGTDDLQAAGLCNAGAKKFLEDI